MQKLRDGFNVVLMFVLIAFIANSLFRVAMHFLAAAPIS